MRDAARTPGRSVGAAAAIGGALLLVAVAAGCAPRRATRANLPQLQMRAVFDLGCHVSQLQLYHVDRRTKIVAGCGRRLTYQEQCIEAEDRRLECSWSIDSPRADQATWPGASLGAAAAVATPRCPAPEAPSPSPAGGRPIYTDLFQDRDAATPPARATPPAPPTESRRPIKTELLDSDLLNSR